MSKIQGTYYAFLFALCSACGSSPEGKVIAEAYGNKLFAEDLQMVISSDVTLEDSVFMAKEFVNAWLGKQVLLHKSEELLSPEEKNKSDSYEVLTFIF